MEFCQILTKLMSERNITAYKLWKETNIPQSVIGKWKSGAQKPTSESLSRLSAYFNVSTDYLLGNEEKKTSPHEHELVLLKIAQSDENTKTAVKLLKQLTPEKFAQALDYLNYLAKKD